MTAQTAGSDGLQAVISVDGASRGNPGPAGAGVVIRAPQGDVLQELSVPLESTTNNVAEYTALLEGLRAAQALGLHRVELRTDSELLFRQLKGIYRVKNARLRVLHQRALGLIRLFEQFRLRQVPREQNGDADRLADAAAAQAARPGSQAKRQGSLEL
jgi:ribonuclease HI